MNGMRQKICEGFFTILATGPEEQCGPLFEKQSMQMKAMSAQMLEYNSTLTVFTVRDSKDPACTFNLPNIKMQDFDPKKLLLEYNYGEGTYI